MKKNQRRIKSSSTFDRIDEISGIQSLDDLVRIQSELKGEDSIPSSFIIEVLDKELSSRELIHLNKNIRINTTLNTAVKELKTLLSNIPGQLYFFLWSLKNSDIVPIEGVITSFQLKKSIYYLTKFLLIVEICLKYASGIKTIYENIGLVYFDLAGIARYSHRGLLINGKLRNYTSLLWKAIACLQYAIKAEANQGKKFDSTHLNIFSIVDHSFSFKENRTNVYLNPWHFLYIASALQQLNDTEIADVYLQKVRLILNSIDNHQNSKIVAQKNLLEAVYSTIKNGDSISFDFDTDNLDDIDTKLKRIRKYKNSDNDKRSFYSPLVEDALTHQLQIQQALVKQGVFNTEQISYLKGIINLYQQVPSASERDKLIYRLNIPPIRISGSHTSIKYLLNKNPKTSLKIKALASSAN